MIWFYYIIFNNWLFWAGLVTWYYLEMPHIVFLNLENHKLRLKIFLWVVYVGPSLNFRIFWAGSEFNPFAWISCCVISLLFGFGCGCKFELVFDSAYDTYIRPHHSIQQTLDLIKRWVSNANSFISTTNFRHRKSTGSTIKHKYTGKGISLCIWRTISLG